MDKAKKTRGVWIIHVSGPSDEQSTDVGHAKCNTASCGGISRHGEREKVKKEKEE